VGVDAETSRTGGARVVVVGGGGGADAVMRIRDKLVVVGVVVGAVDDSAANR